MLYREIIAVCSQIHTKHINTLCGQNVEFLNVKPGGTYSNHWALEGWHATMYEVASLHKAAMRNDRFVLARNATSELACCLRDSTSNKCQGILDVRLNQTRFLVVGLRTAGCSRHPSTCSVRTGDTAHYSMNRSGTMIWQHPEHSKRVNVREDTKMNLCAAAQAYGSC